MTARDRRRFFICLGLALAIGIGMSASYVRRLLPGIDQMQNLMTDSIIFKTRSEENRAKSVVLVHIDEKSVSALKDTYGRVFSWPRTLHAQVLRNLADAKARVVAYDILFDAPGCPATAPQPCEEDLAFAEAIAYAKMRSGGGTQVILAVEGFPPETEKPTPGEPLSYKDTIPPLPILARDAIPAHIKPFPDEDGSVRRMPLVMKLKGQEMPAISLQAAAAYLRRPQAVEQRGRNFIFFGGRPIPTDEYYNVLVNYQGKPSHLPDRLTNPPVATVSFSDVLSGAFDRKLVEDKAIFIGLTAIGFADDYYAPTSIAGVKMSGVEVHAQTAEMILRGAYLQQQGGVSTIIVILLLTVLPGVILARLQPVLAGGITLVLFFAYVVATIIYGAQSEATLDKAQTYTVLNNVYPGLAMLATFIVVMLYRIVFEQAEQRATKGAMGKYLSSAVMTEVLKDPDALQLGGQKREMTVLFTDIRGFTSISEKMDPTALVNFLNGYLTEMTNIVFNHGGVLDKYMGDAIMAFWGAPTDQPKHASFACRTGFDMMRRLHELQKGWLEQGLPPLNIGVGINTGAMTVGNVGSKMRFDYTVMGDAVNLGSRLEGVNKEYGTNIIISDTTYAQLDGEFVVRFLDLIAVKGKKEPTAIYELVAPVDQTDAVPPPEFLQAWTAAMDMYREQQFDEARALFEKALEIRPEDGPALIFVERCTEMSAAPPGLEWDGVYVMTHK
ncbi:MAG: CHASE2 domain-containing protein [Chloroflexi bacterium]|nr:CHASE2 domain-containing protein [Chloroflexota bacterium]